MSPRRLTIGRVGGYQVFGDASSFVKVSIKRKPSPPLIDAPSSGRSFGMRAVRRSESSTAYSGVVWASTWVATTARCGRNSHLMSNHHSEAKAMSLARRSLVSGGGRLLVHKDDNVQDPIVRASPTTTEAIGGHTKTGDGLDGDNLAHSMLVDEADEQEGEESTGSEEEAVLVVRRRRERRDSVTDVIVREREAHQRRLSDATFDRAMAKKFKSMSLGTRKKPRDARGFNLAFSPEGKQVHSNMGAGGFAKWMGSAARGWPQFKHRLPEVALAGHTNCGKSTLVNALSGIHPRRGPASTSDRAGWTDLVGFFQVGKKPPVLTLVDLPGYGHAVATKHAIRGWLRMIQDYITTRQELCCCCVLVDCTRGFCEEDKSLVQLLASRKVHYQIVLTKADLLTPELLSACVLLLRQDVSDLVGQEQGETVTFSAVCGTSAAGVNALWTNLEQIAFKSPGSLVAVQEAHAAARLARGRASASADARRSTSREH